MAKRTADGAPKKPYSSKLMQMKFMQRGNRSAAAPQTKETEVEDPESTSKEEKDDEEWIANRGAEASCTVIFEGDPIPGGTSGRFTFSGQQSAPAAVAESSAAQQEPTISTEQTEPKPESTKKRKKASVIREERFDSPKIDNKGRYFLA